VPPSSEQAALDPVARKTVQLSIPQLDTASETADLGNALMGISGVERVSMAPPTVSVEYDPHFVREALIRELVKNAGYPEAQAGSGE
jgi:copper chaperone CopZ